MRGRKVKKIKLLTTAITAICFASPLWAAMPIPAGWYVEGNVGSSRSYNITYISNTSAGNSGLGWSVNGGFKFLPYTAFEVGYTNYSDANIEYGGSKVGEDSRYIFDFAGKGILPLFSTGAELFAKLGLARISSTVKVTNNTIVTANNLTAKTGTYVSESLYYGVGADYSITNHLSINGQWTRAQGNSNTGTLDLISGGLTYIFG